MSIQWNRVTWYSKLGAIVLFVGTFYIGFYLGEQKAQIPISQVIQPEASTPKTITTGLKDGLYCFVRSQIATKTEPSTIKENIVLNINGSVVTGTKKGTQSGPELTNGYDGYLNGTISRNNLELIYAYTVEGSNNKELEDYEFQDMNLVKLRWPLVEQNKMLVPNKVGNPTMSVYMPENC